MIQMTKKVVIQLEFLFWKTYGFNYHWNSQGELGEFYVLAVKPDGFHDARCEFTKPMSIQQARRYIKKFLRKFFRGEPETFTRDFKKCLGVKICDFHQEPIVVPFDKPITI